jgi:predicted small metal-binding protein
MAQRLDCIVDGCDATIEGESESAVLTRAEAHAAEAHPDLQIDEETMETIRANIREV